jgi:hypothetical protein
MGRLLWHNNLTIDGYGRIKGFDSVAPKNHVTTKKQASNENKQIFCTYIHNSIFIRLWR